MFKKLISGLNKGLTCNMTNFKGIYKTRMHSRMCTNCRIYPTPGYTLTPWITPPPGYTLPYPTLRYLIPWLYPTPEYTLPTRWYLPLDTLLPANTLPQPLNPKTPGIPYPWMIPTPKIPYPHPLDTHPPRPGYMLPPRKDLVPGIPYPHGRNMGPGIPYPCGWRYLWKCYLPETSLAVGYNH